MGTPHDQTIRDSGLIIPLYFLLLMALSAFCDGSFWRRSCMARHRRRCNGERKEALKIPPNDAWRHAKGDRRISCINEYTSFIIHSGSRE
ncbi:uncharacterized protein J3D65DRAFT_617568 [Phyllosticta citribraziliensis]|uniref:Secreted protein n=1 Tax=Phyllosticta citribraziliensis TaxID=989973 RepID=A0ABR1M2X6_9PEZI